MKRIIKHIKQNNIRGLITRSWSLCWPMSVIMFFIFLINLTDVFVAGRISKQVQAAFGFVSQIYFFFVVFISSMNVGAVAVISKLYSSNKKDDLETAVSSSIISAAIIGILLGSGAYIIMPLLIEILPVPFVIKKYSISLIRIYAIGMVFHYFLMNSNVILRSCNLIRKSMRTMIYVSIFNIVYNFFFSFHTPLGYRGIAVATVLSFAIGAIMNLHYLRHIVPVLKRVVIKVVRKLFSVGWPIGILQISWSLSMAVVYIILAKLPQHTIEVMAALTNGIRIEMIIFLPAFAFNLANAVVVGNLMGEGKQNEAFHNGLVTACIGLFIVTVLSILIIIYAPVIVSVLSPDSLVRFESVRYIRIIILVEPLMAWGLILCGALNGAGDTKSVMYRIVFSFWVVRIPLVLLLVVVFKYGPACIWWGMNISIIVQAILITRRYFSKKWLKTPHLDLIPESAEYTEV